MSMKKIAQEILTAYFEEELIIKKTKKINSEMFVAQIIKEGEIAPFWCRLFNCIESGWKVLDDDIEPENFND